MNRGLCIWFWEKEDMKRIQYQWQGSTAWYDSNWAADRDSDRLYPSLGRKAGS